MIRWCVTCLHFHIQEATFTYMCQVSSDLCLYIGTTWVQKTPFHLFPYNNVRHVASIKDENQGALVQCSTQDKHISFHLTLAQIPCM